MLKKMQAGEDADLDFFEPPTPKMVIRQDSAVLKAADIFIEHYRKFREEAKLGETPVREHLK